MTECVEVCPWCEAENVFTDYDPEADGYKVHCSECGAEIMLCDECLHNTDNPKMACDWHKTVKGDKEYGLCFRGNTVNKRISGR